MIRDQWYAILDSHELPRRRPVGVTRPGKRLIQGDLPIIEYRKIRARLQERAASGRQ